MPIMNVTYAHNPRFAAPRSYWRGILIGYGSGATVALAGNIIHIHEPIVGGVIDSYIMLAPNFVPWSSNGWTLDHIFIDQYSQINGGDPIYFHAIIDCGLMTPSPKFGAGFTYDGATQTYNIFLADAPPTYWLPEIP